MAPTPHHHTKKRDLLPKDEAEALQWVLPLLDLEARTLQDVPEPAFKRTWYAIAFLYAGLHPDSALDHGSVILDDASDYPLVSREEPRLINPYYEESGWPVVLAPVAAEAWRRYENDHLNDNEFYCADAQRAGMLYRARQEPTTSTKC